MQVVVEVDVHVVLVYAVVVEVGSGKLVVVVVGSPQIYITH